MPVCRCYYCFLADLHSVKKFLRVVDEFGRASGAKLNKNKCSGIWLVRYAQNSLLLNYCNIKWESNATNLSIYTGVEDIDNAN